MEVKLTAIRNGEYDLPGLTAEVRARSRFVPQNPERGFNGFPLFHVGHTGVGRRFQEYICRVPECTAYVKYQLCNGRATFSGACFTHNHDVELTAYKGVDSLTPEERKEIQDLTRKHYTAEQILQQIDLALDAQVLYDARRSVLAELKSNQAEKLARRVSEWTEFETYILRDADNKFQGYYAFQTAFTDTEVCRQTLVMDDQACTNAFLLPLVLIVASDEHNLTQLIAYALMMDRTKFSFKDFLIWVKKRLVKTDDTEDSASESDSTSESDDDAAPVPRAFVVDRHDGQFAALKEVYPRSRVVFCRFHLGANLRATFGKDSVVRTKFVQLMDCEITEETFVAFIRKQQKHYSKTSKQGNQLQFLLDNLDHYSPARIGQDTRHQASSIVEGANSGVKRMLGHLIVTLEEVAASTRLVALRFFGNRNEKVPSSPLPSWVMDDADQLALGSYALSVLGLEAEQVPSLFLSTPSAETVAKVNNRQCCRIAIMSKLPCCHWIKKLLDEHCPLGDSASCPPLLQLKGIPNEYRRATITSSVRATHTVAQVDPARQRPRGSDWSFGHLSQVFEPIFDSARRDKAVQALIRRFLDDCAEHRANHGSPGSGLRDPFRFHCRGRARTYPGRFALCARMMGKSTRKRSAARTTKRGKATHK
jgi:hypothetical protein